MARSRMIKPEFWDDEKLAKISRDARLLFIGLWNHADDYGVVKGNPTWLKNHIFPYDDSLSTQAFKKWLTELENGSWILSFDDNGERFYYIRNFSKHQVINRPSKQRNAIIPDKLIDGSCNTHGVLMDETETETETEDKPETFDDPYYKFSKRFYEYVQQEYPDKKIELKNGKVKHGAETIRKLVEIDKFNLDTEIRPALQWALQDDFWTRQINSLAELRKKRAGSENHKFYNLFQQWKKNNKSKVTDIIY